jgi:hypothetical protein
MAAQWRMAAQRRRYIQKRLNEQRPPAAICFQQS